MAISAYRGVNGAGTRTSAASPRTPTIPGLREEASRRRPFVSRIKGGGAAPRSLPGGLTKLKGKAIGSCIQLQGVEDWPPGENNRPAQLPHPFRKAQAEGGWGCGSPWA